MAKGILLGDDYLGALLTHGVLEHFAGSATEQFTAVGTTGSNALSATEVGGVVVVDASSTAAANNNERYLASKNKFKWVAGKPIDFTARLKFEEGGSANAGNLFVGFADAVAAALLVNGSAGPKVSGSMMAFYKQGGKTTWSVVWSLGSSQIKVDLDSFASLTRSAQTASKAAYQVLQIQCVPRASVNDISFLIDGRTVFRVLDRPFNAAAVMEAAVGVKTGAATRENLLVDFIGAKQSI